VVVVPLRLCVRRPSLSRTRGADENLQMTITVPSELGMVEHAVDIVARHCLACGLSARAVRFNLRVALSEALANAIVYGNRLDPGKRVHVALRRHGAGVEVHVRDQGEGFDPGGIPDPRHPDAIERTAGRGLFLIRELVDDLVFNEEGNAICMTLHRA
jgi:serine/threonine-protein kinase RsbW